MALEGLRVVYTDVDGNLYVQDSGKPAMQLTHDVKESIENHAPLISDDGQKIIFYRAGESNLDLMYVINADGTGEQVLVNPELLSAFGRGYDKFTALFSLAFVPGTHLLLFNTHQQGNFDPEAAGWLPIVGNDLFAVNTDDGEIKQLKEPWQGGNFLAAPNGKWVAVQTLDHIDIIDVQGRILRGNLVKYSKAEEHVIVPMVWTSDSQELIVLPSDIPLFAGVPVERNIWRYPVLAGSGAEIKLTPPVVYNVYAVSPDGNWIAYFYSSDATPGLYLGDLRAGTSQRLFPLQLNMGYIEGWSPDNEHFIFMDDNFRMYVASIHGEISPIDAPRGPELAGWIDNNRYLLETGVLGEIGKQELVRVMEHYSGTFAFLGH